MITEKTNCKDLGKHGHLLNDKSVVGLIYKYSLPKQLLWQPCGQSYFHPQLLWYFLNFNRIIFIKNVTHVYVSVCIKWEEWTFIRRIWTNVDFYTYSCNRFRILTRLVAPLLRLSTYETEIPWQSNVENLAVFYPKIGHLGVDVVRNVQNITQKQKRKSCFTFFLTNFSEDMSLMWDHLSVLKNSKCSLYVLR